MKVLVFLVYVFVNTFGITQPTPAGARKAARSLGAVLVVAALAAAGAAIWLWSALRP